MRITIKDPLVRNRINERNSFTVTPYFWDDSTDPWTAQTPTNVNYRLDCLQTGTAITGWTSVTPGTSVSITIPSASNIIQDANRLFEVKQLTVAANYGLTTQYQVTFTYQIDNLLGQP